MKNTKAVKWASYIPPTARVRATLKGAFNDAGQLAAANDVVASAGAFEGTLDGPTAASELGLTFEAFVVFMKQNPEHARLFGSLLVKGGTAQRVVFQEKFPELARLVADGPVHRGRLPNGGPDEGPARRRDLGRHGPGCP